MKRNRFVFSLWLLMLLILYAFGENVGALYLFIGSLLFLVISIIQAVSLKKKIIINLDSESKMENGEHHLTYIMTLDVEKSIGMARCTANFQFTNLYNGETQEITETFLASSGPKKSISMEITSKFSGKGELALKELYVSDLLKIVMLKATPNTAFGKWKKAVLMVPETYQVDTSLSLANFIDQEADNYSQDKGGNDPSETFAIREYAEGDRMKSIHWKLSNKLNQMMIREPGLPVKSRALLLVETCFPEEGEDLYVRGERVAAAMLSFSEKLLDLGISHHMGFMDYEENTFRILSIDSTENLIELLPVFLATRLKSGQTSVEDKFMEEENSLEFSHVRIINDEVNKK